MGTRKLRQNGKPVRDERGRWKARPLPKVTTFHRVVRPHDAAGRLLMPYRVVVVSVGRFRERFLGRIKQLGWSVAQAAEALGVPKVKVRGWGYHPALPLRILRSIEAVLGVDRNYWAAPLPRRKRRLKRPQLAEKVYAANRRAFAAAQKRDTLQVSARGRRRRRDEGAKTDSGAASEAE